ncbi:unnamed protein product [Echinostoma caproni]|uniref:Uncharacterized protein n=1 Tax=Echinostoma caproni TaxID=27848 RepID=A0A3P8L1U5_9TREM|nr:unnamed protein product [Echinostoma caproni]
MVAIRNMIRRVTQLRRYEVPLEAVEALVRYLGCVHIIVRTAIMIHNLTVLRRQLIVHWRQFRHFIRCDRRFGSPSSHVNCFLRQDGTNLLPEINRGSTRLNRSVNHGVNRTSKKNNLDALECVEVGMIGAMARQKPSCVAHWVTEVHKPSYHINVRARCEGLSALRS